jgi:hypothetical protein
MLEPPGLNPIGAKKLLGLKHPKKAPTPSRKLLVPLNQSHEFSAGILNAHQSLTFQRLAYLPQYFLLS